jgi:hypothetical protein
LDIYNVGCPRLDHVFACSFEPIFVSKKENIICDRSLFFKYSSKYFQVSFLVL